MVASLKSTGIEKPGELIDKSTSSGKLIFHVFGALAVFERNVIRERTMAELSATPQMKKATKRS